MPVCLDEIPSFIVLKDGIWFLLTWVTYLQVQFQFYADIKLVIEVVSQLVGVHN